MKTLADVQSILRQHLPEVQQKYQVRELGIFGSFVWGEQTDTSDVDVLVEFDSDARFGLAVGKAVASAAVKLLW
ncbi:nucleotidyltransferase family protein [Sphaerothrix gracilis]|uniref:nucleotidyltransferase family protein n=1 Tax=Sphaerothrix gracilis TaxID=3151835 RepID=UPI0031FD3F3D